MSPALRTALAERGPADVLDVGLAISEAHASHPVSIETWTATLRTTAGTKLGYATGDRVTWPRSLLRNLLKLGLPWTLGHAGAVAVAYGGGWDAQLGAVLSLLVPVAYLVSLFAGSGRTIYDHLAGTTVIETAPGRRFAD